MHIIPSVSTQTLMRIHYVNGHVDQFKEITFKMVHSEGCSNLFPGKYTGNKCTATSVNMFIARNTYEVTILAYVEQIGLEKN